MKRVIVAVLLVLLVSLGHACQAEPEIQGKREYAPYTLVRLQVTGVPTKTGFLWRVYPPSIDRASTSKDILQFAAAPGTYDVEVLLVSVDGEGNPSLDSIQTRVVIGTTPPGPTPPGPTPPGPTPPGPTPPPDDLTKELKALYEADTHSQKQKIGRQLAELYRWGAAEALKPEHVTAGQLDVALFRKAQSSVENGLDGLRQRVADKCKGLLGGADPKTPLTDDRRKALADLFGKLAVALTDISK